VPAAHFLFDGMIGMIRPENNHFGVLAGERNYALAHSLNRANG